MDSRSVDLALVLENPNCFANHRGTLRFHDHHTAAATSAHNTVAPGMTASRLYSGSSFQTNIAKIIRPMLDIATPAASAPAAYLPRCSGCQHTPEVMPYFCLKTLPSFITNCTFSSRLTSFNGSPVTATRSANFPSLTEPIWSVRPSKSAAEEVAA